MGVAPGGVGEGGDSGVWCGTWEGVSGRCSNTYTIRANVIGNGKKMTEKLHKTF